MKIILFVYYTFLLSLFLVFINCMGVSEKTSKKVYANEYNFSQHCSKTIRTISYQNYTTIFYFTDGTVLNIESYKYHASVW